MIANSPCCYKHFRRRGPAAILRSITMWVATLIVIFTSSNAGAVSQPKYNWSGEWHLRFEQLSNPLLSTTSPAFHQHNQRISSKFELKGSVNWRHLQLIGGFADSRVYLDNDDPTLGRSQVNTYEPIQFRMGWQFDIAEEDGLQLKNVGVGRFLLDYGSRRLVGSAFFRNAHNAFDGLVTDWRWDNWSIAAIYLLPVSRFPNDPDSIDNNDRAFDKSNSERRFYGFYAASDDNVWRLHSYWLNEQDGPGINTRNRQLMTLSAHYMSPEGHNWITDVELALQTGTQRQSTATADKTDLDHNAWMLHASFGRKVNNTTVLSAVLDVASGDNNDKDGKSNGFDTLFGVRRFDFGPTDVYGSFPRQNLVGVGAKWVNNYNPQSNLLLHYRAYWYQKALVDGDDFLGNQFEFRWRYQYTKPLRLEVGGAYMFKGSGLAKGDYPNDTAYAYSGFRLQF